RKERARPRGAPSGHGRRASGAWQRTAAGAGAICSIRALRRAQRPARRRRSGSSSGHSEGCGLPAATVFQLNDNSMKLRSVIARIVQHENLNFLLTNRIPRRWLTLFLGWFSKVEQPLVRELSLLIWRLFSDLDLSDARRQSFRSLHDCFTRELREGARPLDTDSDTLVSPCDAIVGVSGRLEDGTLLQ